MTGVDLYGDEIRSEKTHDHRRPVFCHHTDCFCVSANVVSDAPFVVCDDCSDEGIITTALRNVFS